MRSYTIKIPPQWAGINSARTQAYLREYFIHPLTLPADPGAGDRAVCLTLNEKLVSKLAEGTGEKAAVALRRLLAARVRELPAAEIVRARSEPERKSKARYGSPAWYQLETPWEKLKAGQREYYEELHQVGALGSVSVSLPEMPRVETVFQKSWLARVFSDPAIRPLIRLVVLVALIVLAWQFGTSRSASPVQPGKPRFRAWRPE